MKLTTAWMIVVMAASASVAQNTPAAQVAKPSPAPRVAPAKVGAAERPKAKKLPKPARIVRKPAAEGNAAAAKPTVPVNAQAALDTAGKRDPFQTIIVERGGGSCKGTGKKCLIPDRVILQGVVRSSTGSRIAVVVNPENRTYFLRVNEPVFNGVVTSITDSSITFREHGVDAIGRATSREIVKKIVVPPV
ncbi:MAG TPA: hypothetical protein VEG32_10370 [Clostridia bacterium]|nr:hypothetical protein [Clostridia bacterium]